MKTSIKKYTTFQTTTKVEYPKIGIKKGGIKNDS